MSNKTIDLNKYDNKLQAVVFSDFKEVSPTDNVAADPSSWFVVGYKSGGTSTANSERRYSLSDLKSALNIGNNNNNVSINCTYIRLSEAVFTNLNNNFNSIQTGWENNFPSPNDDKPYLICKLTVDNTSVYLVSKDGKDGEDGSSGSSLTMDEVQTWVNSQNFLKTESDPNISQWARAANKPTYNYNEIQGTPIIPAAANDATITIQKNRETIGNFTTNASSDKSINIEVPTETQIKTLIGREGYLKASDYPVPSLSDVLTAGDHYNYAGNNQIKELANPTEDKDAVNKLYLINYVQSELSAINTQLQALQNQIDSLDENVVSPTVMFYSTPSTTTTNSITLSATIVKGTNDIDTFQFFTGTSENNTTTEVNVDTGQGVNGLISTANSKVYKYSSIPITLSEGTTYFKAVVTTDADSPETAVDTISVTYTEPSEVITIEYRNTNTSTIGYTRAPSTSQYEPTAADNVYYINDVKYSTDFPIEIRINSSTQPDITVGVWDAIGNNYSEDTYVFSNDEYSANAPAGFYYTKSENGMYYYNFNEYNELEELTSFSGGYFRFTIN